MISIFYEGSLKPVLKFFTPQKVCAIVLTFKPFTDFMPFGGGGSESQSQQFRDFLLRANRYQTLQIEGPASSKKVILVEVSDLLFVTRNV